MKPARTLPMANGAPPRAAVLGLLAVTCSLLSAMDGDQMASVTIDGLSLEPGGNLRDAEHRVEIHPKLLLGAGWDDNAIPPPIGDGASDAYLKNIAGIVLRYHPQFNLDAEFDAEIGQISYQDNPILDTYIGHLRARIDHESQDMSWHADAGWNRSQDAIFTTGEKISQDSFDVHGLGTYDGPLWFGTVDSVISFLDYRQATSTFDQDQGDNAKFIGGLTAGHKHNEERYFIFLQGELVRYRVSTYFNDCNALTSALGSTFNTSSRSTLTLEGGVESRRYTSEFQSRPGSNDSLAISPWGVASFSWSWRDGNRLGLRAYSDLSDSQVSNATWSLGTEVGGHVNLDSRWSLDADLGISHDRDGGMNRPETRFRELVREIDVSCQYAIAAGLSSRIQAVFDRVQTPNDAGYDRLVVSLDVAYVY